MPIQPTYPGVYVEELPSGVHTITGVATSITAFIGRAQSGPVNVPITISSYADFERTFGGLWAKSALGFAVQDFYMNGGSQAIIVRLFEPDVDDSGNPVNMLAKFTVGGLSLTAASPGQWGNNIVVALDHNVTPDNSDGTYTDPEPTEVFNLTVSETVNGQTVPVETFRNLTVADGPRRIDKVLTAGSQYVAWDSADTPLPSSTAVTTAAKAIAPVVTAQNTLITAQNQLIKDQKAKADPATIAKDQTSVNTATTDLNNAMQTLNAQTSSTTATDGKALTTNSFDPQQAGLANKQGLYALENADLFNILCVPPYNDLVQDDGSGDIDTTTLLSKLAAYCVQRRAMLMVDSPSLWLSPGGAMTGLQEIITGIGSTNTANAAIFFPRLQEANPFHDNQIETFVSCGAMAGVFASTDTQRGVWKAPAGTQAGITGITGLSVPLTNGENGELNPLGINCLRVFPATGAVVWGARTMQGDDRLTSQWKYIPVRRTALFLEESLYRGLQWVVFEPNDEPLWAQIRLNVTSFMQDLFRKGAFQGSTPQQAYLVKCDSETTTQTDIDNGIVNIIVGFAPLKPAEFVILQIEQLAGQTQS